MNPRDEWLASIPHTFSPRVLERIRRLTRPDLGPREMIRGYHPAAITFGLLRDVEMCVGPRAFIARWGREAYRRLPAEAFWRGDGKRVHIRRRWMLLGA